MKKIIALFVASVMSLFFVSCETLDLNQLMSQGTQGGVSLETITAGLREALEVGSTNAVKEVTGKDGFVKNASRKILIPSELKPVENKLRQFKMGFLIDNFVEKMNQSAEKAASKASPVFVKAIKDMSFDDAKRILNGGGSSATDYFKVKTGPELREMFNPVIKNAMDEYGVVSLYDNMLSKYNAIPFTRKIDFKIENYITDKTLDGLFYALADQEKLIRTDPVARTSELLQKVFGSN